MLFHNAVVLARRFATLMFYRKEETQPDWVIGWSKDEYQISSVPFRDKGKRADEFIQALKEINTYLRIVNNDANGRLGLIGGPLEYLENIIKTIKDQANKANKDPDIFNVILLTHPNIVYSKNQSTNKVHRFPLTEAIHEIGSDIQRIQQMGVSHIIFGYNFVHTGRDDEI